MTYQEFENQLKAIRNQNKTFDQRRHEYNALIFAVADKAADAGYGARPHHDKEHTQVGRHHRIQYTSDWIPVGPDGSTIGCEVFGTLELATAFGYLKHKNN
jgi:hypothetical protein